MRDDTFVDTLTACISPCVLPTGLSPVSRTQVRSYEFYYPAVATRQLGFGQLPPCLFYSDKTKGTALITSNIEFNRVVDLTDNLDLGTFADLIMEPLSSRPFNAWWSEWHLHNFCKNSAFYL